MTDDPISLASRAGLIDEAMARRTLGGDTPTADRLVELGIACARCGRTITRDGTALRCRPCGVRVEVGAGERYERRRMLGQGGFGEVWLALDRELNREVAIKYLSSASGDDLARFKREARLAAGLKHPGIVGVHDVGDGFLVMDYIPGHPADEVPLSPRDAVEVVRQAAEAVAHAHERGVIHRDLKPANILVAAGRAYVADFGLAKSLGVDSSLSISGDVFGTPAFMPPEQARGALAEVGPHSDVYSLGATLYALLSGGAPFRGRDVYDVVRCAIEVEPPPPPVERDLQVIVQKAMMKEPSRRYAGAAALAEDLRRYLAGEPISAKPVSRWYRLRRRIASNPWAWGLGAAAATAVVAGVWAAAGWRGEALGAEARAALDRAEKAQLVWRPRRYLPRHDVTPYRRGLVEAEAALRRALEIEGDQALILGELGRVLLELDRPDEALGPLDRAATLAPREGAYPWLRARAEDRIAERERRRARRSHSDAMRAAGERAAEARQARATELMRRAVALAQWSRAEPWERDYANAYLLDREGRRDEARVACERIVETYRVEGSEEAMLLLARLTEDPEERVRRYERAAEHAPSYAPALAAAAEELAKQRDERLDRAFELATFAVEVDPDRAESWEVRALVRINRSIGVLSRGLDAEEIAGIESDLARALALQPQSSQARVRRAAGRMNLGLSAAWRGTDPAPHYRGALEDIDEAARLSPDDPDALWSRAHVLINWGVFLGGRGGTPVAELDEAERLLERVEALRPKEPGPSVDRAALLLNRGALAARTGEDPTEHFRRGIEAVERALAADPTLASAHARRGSLRTNWANWLAANGGDPREFWTQAVHEDYARAVELDPDSPEWHLERGAARSNLATRAGDPDEEFRLAVEEDLAAAARLAPARADVWLRLGVALQNWGLLRLGRGVVPTDLLRRAIEEGYEKSLALNPNSSEANTGLGNSAGMLALVSRAFGGDAAEADRWAARSEEAFARAVELNPADAEPRRIRGILRLLGGRAAEALADLEEAVRLNPSLAESLRERIEQARAAAGEQDF